MLDYTAIHKTCLELARIGSLSELYGYIGDTVSSALDLRSICLLSAVSGGDFEVVYQASFKDKGVIDRSGETGKIVIDEDSAISGCFEDTGKAIVRKGLLNEKDSPNQKVIESMKSILELDRVDAAVGRADLFTDQEDVGSSVGRVAVETGHRPVPVQGAGVLAGM